MYDFVNYMQQTYQKSKQVGLFRMVNAEDGLWGFFVRLFYE